MAAAWSLEQLEYLQNNYHKNDIADLIEKIGKSKYAIRWKASQLGILLRDGLSEGQLIKKTISVTERHNQFLIKHKFNQSDIVKIALDLYIEKFGE